MVKLLQYNKERFFITIPIEIVRKKKWKGGEMLYVKLNDDEDKIIITEVIENGS